MKTKVIIIILLIIIVLSGLLYKKYRIAPDLDLTSLQIEDMSGNSFEIKDIESNLTVLHFWASWCGPCRKELPVISELADSFDSGDVKFVLVSDETSSQLRNFLQDTNYSIQFYRMNNDLKSLGINTVPTTYFLDDNMEIIRSKVNGIDWNSEDLLNWMRNVGTR